MGKVTGDIRVLLSGERVALNYLQRMSGIATYTHSVASLLEGTGITLLDTRKTTPNMRIFEKYAVREAADRTTDIIFQMESFERQSHRSSRKRCECCKNGAGVRSFCPQDRS